MKYLVIRKPCIPEDEGRYFGIKTYKTHREAWDWIEKQEGKYFGPGNYTVAEMDTRNWRGLRGTSDDATTPSDD